MNKYRITFLTSADKEDKFVTEAKSVEDAINIMRTSCIGWLGKILRNAEITKVEKI